LCSRAPRTWIVFISEGAAGILGALAMGVSNRRRLGRQIYGGTG
jgi:hypothetical protein